MNKLSARAVQTLKEPGRHSDGGGLYLSIDASGRRRWVFMFTRDGKRSELGLGGARDLSLAAARTEANLLRIAVAAGRDPRAERFKMAQRVVTFGAFADELVEKIEGGFRNPKHRAQWRSTLTTHAARLRDKPIAQISTADVLDVL